MNRDKLSEIVREWEIGGAGCDALVDEILALGNECVEYTGVKDKHGYGKLRWGDKVELAHRVTYRLFHGAVPAGKCVCHTCDNPACINPSHLFLGTHTDNMRDMWQKGRGYAKMSYEDVELIRNSSLSNGDLAVLIGVGERAIRYAKQKKLDGSWANWKFLEYPLPAPPEN